MDPGRKGTNYRWQLEQDLAARHQYIRARIEIGSTSNIIDFVAKNLGVSLLPSYTLKQAIDAGRIVPFQIKGYDMHMQSQFLVFRKRWIPEAIANSCRISEYCFHLKTYIVSLIAAVVYGGTMIAKIECM